MSKLKLYAILFIVAIVLLVLMIPLMLIGVPPIILAIILCFGIVAAMIIYEKVSDKSSTASYDKESKTLFLHLRCAENEKYIVIKEYEHPHFQYNPAELVYTGATVGGVSMGGFHVNEAYESVGLLEKTGKYELHYGKQGVIETIQCNFEIGDKKLIEKFKKDSKTLFLENVSQITNDKMTNGIKRKKLSNAIKNNDNEQMSVLTKDFVLAKKLTMEDCVNLKNWIAAKD